VIVRALFRLLSLVALALAGWWVARLVSGRRHAGEGPRRPQARTAGQRMVRDRVCNTFLPRERALELEWDGETHYFCSERCRHRFSLEKGLDEPS
jgi:YHS domain-containing protein